MNIELYFLRSSEQKIIADLAPFAYQEDASSIHIEYFGLTHNDLGLYALSDNTIAGAIWARKLHDNKAPKMYIAVLPEFRDKGIAQKMIVQFLEEAGAVFTSLEVDRIEDTQMSDLYEKVGFKQDTSSLLTLTKELEQKEVIRPQDSYDASYWMD